MPIYESYCREKLRIYPFDARTLAKGDGTPSGPDRSGPDAVRRWAKAAVDPRPNDFS